ncbi:DUF3396 domain-containing protein [Salmonella enterica subsp. salamae]|nr:DUF3396 domain-containing protein [Salmonella enterica subsp. salamae]
MVNFRDYTVVENGRKLIEPCFCIALFTSALVTKNMAPEGLLTPYRVFLDDFLPEVNWILTDGNQMRGEKITSQRLDVLENWLHKPRRTVFMGAPPVEIYKGKDADEVSTPTLSWYYDTYFAVPVDPVEETTMSIKEMKTIPQRGFGRYRIKLSLDWLAKEGMSGVENLLARMLKDFPLSFGYAGYSLAYNDRGLTPSLEQFIRQWLLRYPGLLCPESYTEANASAVQDAISGIGWMTILNEEFCQRLGGYDAFAQKLKGFSTLTDLPQNNILIRIGDEPALGDIKAGDLLKIYQSVGSVLRPIFLRNMDQEHMEGRIGMDGLKDNTERVKWLSRFFDCAV